MHKLWQTGYLWRGSLLPFEREALAIKSVFKDFGAASQPSGSKLPRHKGSAEVSVHA
jgi:hypothetical protein